MRKRYEAFILCLIAGIGDGAFAQNANPAPGNRPDGADIVANGRLLRSFGDYVRDMTTGARHGQLARWNTSLCVDVTGLDERYGRVIRDGIVDVAAKIGLSVSRSRNCTPNVVIVFTPDADDLAKAIVRAYPRIFATMTGTSPSETTPSAFEQPRPARWLTVDETGRADDAPPDAPLYFPSRIRSAVKQNVVFTYEIIDADRIRGVTWGQIADYLAMVTFAHPDMARLPGGPESILSLDLTRGSPIPAGMTSQDMAFLKGLYGADPSLTAGQ